MSLELRIRPVKDQNDRPGEWETSSVDISAEGDQLGMSKQQTVNAQEMNNDKDQLSTDSDLFSNLILIDTPKTLTHDTNNDENHQPFERVATMDSAQFLQSRDIDEYFQTDEAADISTQIFDQISASSAGQDIKFSVELSSGRTVDVHAQESSEKWVIGLRISDSDFRDKLLRNQDDMSESLHAGFGKKVELDVT